ncbi:MAG: gliding motility-associated C-terminal domain-containing protein [Bacteroidota bacterium]|jgi:gliding motility-associated-like protein
MRKIFTLFALLVVTSLEISAQCTVSATPTTSTIDCGQSVQLNASATGGTITYSNDFNTGTAGAGWNTNSGAEFTNPCVTNPNGGAAYLWMGSVSAAPRTIETQTFNINCAGSVCFDLALATQGAASPCEGPDLATEGVYLQYSTNFGATWTTIFYFDPNINGSGGSAASPYTTWANYCFPIPAAAISPTTSFRWAQLAISGNFNDHWGIDNVVISGTCANPHYYVWTPPTGLSATNIANPVASPLTTTTYTVYYTDGIADSCSTQVTVNVIQPNVDAGPTQSICLGTGVTLNGSSTTTVNNQVSFSNNTPFGITDYNTTTSNINVTGLNIPTFSTTSISQVCLDITHTWDADLTISLLCPNGAQLILSQANGGAGDNYTQTCFTPTATNIIGSAGFNAAPFTGTFAPEGPGGFSALASCIANGTWSLIVTDNAGGDVGTLNNWSIVFNNNVSPNVTWSPSVGMTGANTYTPTFTPTVSGTYTVSLTTAPGCTATDTVSVFVNPLPSPAAGPDKTICAGNTTNLNASGGATYNWSPPAGLSSSTISNPVASPTVTTSYTVTISNGSCLGKDTIVVNVNPLPPVDAGTNVTICDGNTVNLQASGASSYVWSPSTALSSTNTANSVSTPTNTITYFVTGTDANGCVKTDSVKITVNPTPIASASVDDTICSGSSTTLNGSGAGNFSWIPGTGLNNTAISNPVANPTVTTTYVLTVTNGFNCLDKDTMTVFVNPLPNVDAGTNQIICSGATWQLNASGASTYVWTPTVTLSSSNISNPIATPTASTTYTVTGTDANGCVKSDAVSIVVLSGPSLTTSPDPSICVGASTNISATTPATNITWNPPTGLSSTNTANTTATPTVTTTYTVTATQNGCSRQDSVTVTVNQGPNLNAGPDVTACAGDTVQLNAGGNATTYIWSPASGLSSTSISNPTSTSSSPVTYIVTGIDANGCIDKDTISLNISSALVVNAGNNLSGCSGSGVQLNATGANNFVWSPSAGLSSSTISNPVATLTVTTTFTVVGSNSSGCFGTDSITVVVNPSPQVTVNSESICTGATATLTANGATNYTWSPSGTSSGANSITVSPASTTIYTVTGTDANGCSSTAQATVTVSSTLNASVTTSQISCFGGSNGSATINVNGGSGGYTFVWSSVGSGSSANNLPQNNYTVTVTDASGCQSVLQFAITEPSQLTATLSPIDISCVNPFGSISTLVSGGTPSYSFNWSPSGIGQNPSGLAAGNYTVTVTDANNCSITETVTVGTTASAITASFTSNPTTGTAPLQVSFTNTSTNANNYIWSFGNGSTSSQQNDNTTYTTPGTYTVIMIASNTAGCVDTATATITVLDDFSILVPNIFTPNGDGINDVFFIPSSGLSNLLVQIYDRWGLKLYEITSPSGSWNGGSSPEGTYYYILSAKSTGGKEVSQSGYFQLIK